MTPPAVLNRRCGLREVGVGDGIMGVMGEKKRWVFSFFALKRVRQE